MSTTLLTAPCAVWPDEARLSLDRGLTGPHFVFEYLGPDHKWQYHKFWLDEETLWKLSVELRTLAGEYTDETCDDGGER